MYENVISHFLVVSFLLGTLLFCEAAAAWSERGFVRWISFFIKILDSNVLWSHEKAENGFGRCGRNENHNDDKGNCLSLHQIEFSGHFIYFHALVALKEACKKMENL
jgi:hypothetical protein